MLFFSIVILFLGGVVEFQIPKDGHKEVQANKQDIGPCPSIFWGGIFLTRSQVEILFTLEILEAAILIEKYLSSEDRE